MLLLEIDKINHIAILEPSGSLLKYDFESVSRVIDEYIGTNQSFSGLVIHTKCFSGWDSFSALCAHFDFVKKHHLIIPRVAFSTDSIVGGFAKNIAVHFVSAEIDLFSYDDLNKAKKWASSAPLRHDISAVK